MEQQALAIGRGLMSNPRLLLDEVSLGLAPVVVKQLYAALPAILASGTTLVVVEQDIGQALAAADHVVRLLEGRAARRAPGRARRNAITAAYFGMDPTTTAYRQERRSSHELGERAGFPALAGGLYAPTRPVRRSPSA